MAGFNLLKFLPSSEKQKLSVLVVDDDDFLKPFMARVLYSIDENVDLIWVTDLTQARQVLNSRNISLIIADCMLSERENGFELWSFCKQNFEEIPFVMISGLDFCTIERIADGSGAWPPLLQKPLSMTESRDLIRSLFLT